uniref:JmjC domain-containing protein n=1 Tax=Graphocephala atropunctata TaxID=36148 RepID=A0A1B6LVY8_9HEMI
MAMCSKKFKSTLSPQEIKDIIINSKTPLVFKNTLSWDLMHWSLEDWVENLGNPKLDFRIGTKQCTKVPQWENDCQVMSATLKEVLNEGDTRDSWMYFDYKHMKYHFENKPDLLETMSWADFGFPDKNGNDSTIWIGTKGAYTPCHMDSYGCNIVAQVYGRKLWVMFPQSRTLLLKPTRVPYEESSIYSNIHFTCGLSEIQGVGEAHVVELCPGDVLVVPSHWWHYVENLSTAISVNMWIPLETDHQSRLQEALVRFFVASTLKTVDTKGGTGLLNLNEMDLLEDPLDLRQISWCVEQVLDREESPATVEDKAATITSHHGCVSTVPTMAAAELQRLLLAKCGCVSDCTTAAPCSRQLSVEHIINAFCHPDVIAKVSEVLLSMNTTRCD